MSNDNTKKAPKTSSDSSQPFSAAEMNRRWEKLKAAGKVPPLADVLKIIERTK